MNSEKKLHKIWNKSKWCQDVVRDSYYTYFLILRKYISRLINFWILNKRMQKKWKNNRKYLHYKEKYFLCASLSNIYNLPKPFWLWHIFNIKIILWCTFWCHDSCSHSILSDLRPLLINSVILNKKTIIFRQTNKKC